MLCAMRAVAIGAILVSFIVESENVKQAVVTLLHVSPLRPPQMIGVCPSRAMLILANAVGVLIDPNFVHDSGIGLNT
jgi:hypothetical protein